ncbi:MAG: OB-fold nucleic acid binding domain-containing protein [Actinomycetota bacterium]
MSIFRKIGQRLAEGPEQIRAQEIRLACLNLERVEPIAECRPRTRPRVAGVVQSIKVDPRHNPPVLEVEIFDGTDRVIGVWYGRRQIPGIALGRPIVFQGTIRRGTSGALEILNPAYELVANVE